MLNHIFFLSMATEVKICLAEIGINFFFQQQKYLPPYKIVDAFLLLFR